MSLFRSFLLFFTFLIAVTAQAQPGAGTSLELDGANDFASTPTINLATSSLTLSAWVKVTAFKTTFPFITSIVGTETPNNTALIRLGDANLAAERVQFVLNANGTQNKLDGTMSLVAGQWYHIACTYDGTEMKTYINGILDGTMSLTGQVSSNDIFAIGRNYGDDRILDGEIDEVRVFDTALTQTEIREWMCQRLTPNHPQYASMLAYWRMDEGTGNSLTDLTGNGNTATFTGSPVWRTSAAPLGDESVYQYPANPPLSLAHANGDSLTITTAGTNVNGIHLYRVDSVPNVTQPTLPMTALDTTRYWGVFFAGAGSGYTLEYDFTNHPNVPNICNLGWAERVNPTASNWSLVTVSNIDFANNTLEVQVNGSGQFIFGSTPQGPVNVTWDVTDNLCFGDSAGQAIVTPAGGLPPYTYQWSTSGNTDSTETGLLGGWTVVTVTDGNNCTTIDSIEISDPTEIILTIDSVKDVTCEGGNDGMIITSTTGGALPYFIQWDDPNMQMSPTAINLEEGLYTIMLEDNNGCPVSATTTVGFIFPSPQPDLGNDITTSESFADLMVSGGPFSSYAWSNGANATTTRVFASGTYTVTVTDDNGCTGTDEIEVTVNLIDGIEDLENHYDLTLFPQPSQNDAVQLQINAPSNEILKLELMDLTGKQLWLDRVAIVAGKNNLSIPVAPLAKGLYLLRVTDKQQREHTMRLLR